MILFRTEAATDIGYAHLNRCLLLAGAFRDKGKRCAFAIADDDNAQSDRVRQAGFDSAVIPSADLYNDEVRHYPRSIDTVFVDLQHACSIADPSRLLALLQALTAAGHKTVFLDALFDEAFRHSGAPRLHAYIQPYVGAERDTRPDCDHWLTGAPYAIMAEAYRGQPAKKIAETARNILITFGGADPQELTATVLEAVAQREGQTIRAIEGPYFSEKHKARLHHIARDTGAEVIGAQQAMLPHYRWADIAIGSSGLSRYEFAACGLPALFCAIYPYHVRICEAYAETGAARYLGYYKDIGVEGWRQALDALIANTEARRRMSVKGQTLIEGKGTERILEALGL